MMRKSQGLFTSGPECVIDGTQQESVHAMAAQHRWQCRLAAGNQYGQVDIVEARKANRTIGEQKFKQSGITLAITGFVISATNKVGVN